MNKRAFIILQIAVVIVLSVTMVANTYSWAVRPSQNGNELTLGYSTVINGNSTLGVTYSGTVDTETGKILYDSTPVSEKEAAVAEGDKWYFKTEIQNTSDSAKANVSLYAKNISYAAELDDKFYIGVTYPINTHRTYPATSAHTVEWASIVSQYEVDISSQTVIEWYIEFDAAGSFSISGLYLTNS